MALDSAALIALADAHVAEYEARAAGAGTGCCERACRHQADAWRRHAERLRAIAARRGLPVEHHSAGPHQSVGRSPGQHGGVAAPG
jgi:hypothetical protein